MNFTLTLTLGAGLLAVWLDDRLAARRPKTPARGMTHAVISAFALLGAAALLAFLNGIPQALFMLVVMTVFLPTLVYALLAGFWMLRALRNLTGLAGR